MPCQAGKHHAWPRERIHHEHLPGRAAGREQFDLFDGSVMLNWDEVNRLAEDGYISRQRHPEAPFTIYNYSAKAQYDWHWTPETMACRGLIVADDGEIVARPFPKFFSIEQRGDEPLPVEPFKVYEKVDGSLGILYFINGEPRIATRGSFVSDQAQWATAHLQAKYKDVQFNPDYTYLFEIIYPGNQIVVDYGDFADLVMLAVIRKSDGADMPLENIGFPMVKLYDGVTDFAELAQFEEPNKEGFVIRFESGLRVKAKFAEYKRLHRLLTGLSARGIWEAMQTEEGLQPVLDRVPDEFYSWVKVTESDLWQNFLNIEHQCKTDFKDLGDRKTTALYFHTCQHPAILFKMLDRQEYAPLIWKAIYPPPSRPFKGDDV